MQPPSVSNHVETSDTKFQIPHHQLRNDSMDQSKFHITQVTAGSAIIPTPGHHHTQRDRTTSIHPPTSRLMSSIECPPASNIPFTPQAPDSYFNLSQPIMADHSQIHAWDAEAYHPGYTPTQPLGGSMYAVMTQNHMTAYPDNAMINPVAETRQLSHRISSLEQQMFQQSLNSRFSNMRTSQSIQNLQLEMARMKRHIEFSIPILQDELREVKGRLEAKQNEECTRKISIRPRTRKEKLESAKQNASLARIAAGVSLPDTLNSAQVAIRKAEQMDSMARALRSRVHIGGAAYILEAEDAEAWAAELRADTGSTQTPASKSQTDKQLDTEESNKGQMINKFNALLGQQSEVASDFLVNKISKGLEHKKEDVSGLTAECSAFKEAESTGSTITDFHNDGSSVRPPDSRASSVHRADVVQHITSSRASPITKAGSLQIEDEGSVTKGSSHEASTIHEADSSTSRGRRLAPHRKDVTQHSIAPEPSEAKISGKTELPPSDKVLPILDSWEPESRLSKYRGRRRAPHRRHASQYTCISSISGANTPVGEETTSDETISSPEAGMVHESQSPIARGRKLAPHHRYAAQDTGVLETPVPDNKIVPAIEEDPAASNAFNTHEVEKAAGAQVPVIRTVKLAPHRKHATKQVEVPELPKVEDASTTKDNSIPFELNPGHEEAQEVACDSATEEDPTGRAHESEEAFSKLHDTVTSAHEAAAQTSPEEASTLPTTSLTWRPAYLEALPPLSTAELAIIPPPDKMHHFSRAFLLSQLGGSPYFPSFWHIPPPERSLLPNRGFYLLEDSIEPLGPSSPGKHGCLLTPVLRLFESAAGENPTNNAPLFAKRGKGYIYMGMYTLDRADRLDHQRCSTLIPPPLKTYWANQLTSPTRPDWVTSTLQFHLCPAPTYTGPPPTSTPETTTNTTTTLLSTISTHAREMETWHRTTHLQASFLRAEHILRAFEAADTGAEIPGIRFWCLGLKCEGWDTGFYDMMVRGETQWKRDGCVDAQKEGEKQREMVKMLKRKGVKW